jgi:hypothetical protein
MEKIKQILTNNDGLIERFMVVLNYYADDSIYKEYNGRYSIIDEDRGGLAKELLKTINKINDEYSDDKSDKEIIDTYNFTQKDLYDLTNFNESLEDITNLIDNYIKKNEK